MNREFCPYCMNPVREGEPCESCGLTAGSYTPSPHHIPPGSVLMERYLVGRVLGEGGFGITYIGCDLRLEMKIAIKEYFPTDKAARNAQASLDVCSYTGPMAESYHAGKEKFLREARTMARMDKQPEIVSVRDFFEANNTAYIVMEYIEGTTFKELVRQRGGRLPAGELLAMIEPLFGALSSVHAQGLIHRDISPENLMLEDGSVRLLDFGCARESVSGTETMTVALKQGYAPIEQYQHKGQGPWTDVYALAATIYYCLTGRIPEQALDRLSGDELILPRKLGVELTEDQERALLHAMRITPKRRFQSVDEFHTALYSGAPVPAPVPDPVLEEEKEDSEEKKERSGEEKAEQGTDRKKLWLWGGAAAAAVSVLIICLALALRPKEAAPGALPPEETASVSAPVSAQAPPGEMVPVSTAAPLEGSSTAGPGTEMEPEPILEAPGLEPEEAEPPAPATPDTEAEGEPAAQPAAAPEQVQTTPSAPAQPTPAAPAQAAPTAPTPPTTPAAEQKPAEQPKPAAQEKPKQAPGPRKVTTADEVLEALNDDTATEIIVDGAKILVAERGRAVISKPLTVSGGILEFGGMESISNTSSITVKPGGTLRFNGPYGFANSGTIHSGGGLQFTGPENSASGMVNSGSIVTTSPMHIINIPARNDGTIQAGGMMVVEGGLLTNSAGANITAGDALECKGGLDNRGSITLTGKAVVVGFEFGSSTAFNNAGTMQISSGELFIHAGTTFTNSGSISIGSPGSAHKPEVEQGRHNARAALEHTSSVTNTGSFTIHGDGFLFYADGSRKNFTVDCPDCDDISHMWLAPHGGSGEENKRRVGGG